jgi:hypothetical protein
VGSGHLVRVHALDVAGESDPVVQEAPTTAERDSAVGSGHLVRLHALDVAGESDPVVREAPSTAERGSVVENGRPVRGLTSGRRRGVTNGSPTTRTARTTQQAASTRQRPPATGRRTARLMPTGSARRVRCAGRIRRRTAASDSRQRLSLAVRRAGHQSGDAERDRDWVTVFGGPGTQPAVRACRPSWPGGRTRRSGRVSGTGPGRWSGSAPPSSLRPHGSAGPGPAPRCRCR